MIGGDVGELPSNVKREYTAFSMTTQKEEFAEFAVWWYNEYLPKAISDGVLQPVKYVERRGGLAALQEASRDVLESKVRERIVVYLQEE